MASSPARWSSEPPLAPDQIRRARDDLLARGLLAQPAARSGVPEIIERSWRRCASEAVPTSPASIRYSSSIDLDPRLREAAAPVLERLSEHLADVRVAMFISNERGQIVVRQ